MSATLDIESIKEIYTLNNAVKDVRENNMSIRASAKKHNVGRDKLRARLYEYDISKAREDLIRLKRQLRIDATLFLYDIHIPHEDGEAIEHIIDFVKDNYNTVKIVLGGDIMDCEALSKFDKTKSVVSFNTEVEETNTFLSNLRDRFPKAKIDYIIGNHEERIEKYIMRNAPELVDIVDSIPSILDTREFCINVIDNRRLKFVTGQFYKVNNFTILHGHELGICPIVSPAHKFLEKAKDNIIFGHIHAPDEKIITNINGEVLRSYSVGTLCKLSPLYKPFNTWGHGFAIMEHRDDGDLVRNFRVFDGRIF